MRKLRTAELFAPLRNADARRCITLEVLLAMFFGTSIMQTYYESLGLGQDQVNNLQSIQAIMMVAIDLPGGYLADRFGVRRMIIAGVSILSMNAVYFAACRTYTEFCVSLVLSGVAWALLSGTTSSLMTATLSQDTYNRYDWWVVQARCAGQIVAIVIGYFMVKYGSMALPYWLQPVTYVGCVVAAVRLERRFVKASHLPLAVITRTAKEMLVRRGVVRSAVLFFASMSAGMMLAFWLLQPRLRESGVSVVNLGLVYLLKNISTSIFGAVVGAWSHRGKSHKRLIASLGILLLTTAGMSIAGSMPFVIGGYLLIFGHSLCIGLYSQVQRILFREVLPEDPVKRTTELSVYSSFASLYFAALSYGFGKLAVITSVRMTLAGIAVATLVVGIPTFIILWRSLAKR